MSTPISSPEPSRRNTPIPPLSSDQVKPISAIPTPSFSDGDDDGDPLLAGRRFDHLNPLLEHRVEETPNNEPALLLTSPKTLSENMISHIKKNPEDIEQIVAYFHRIGNATEQLSQVSNTVNAPILFTSTVLKQAQYLVSKHDEQIIFSVRDKLFFIGLSIAALASVGKIGHILYLTAVLQNLNKELETLSPTERVSIEKIKDAIKKQIVDDLKSIGITIVNWIPKTAIHVIAVLGKGTPVIDSITTGAAGFVTSVFALIAAIKGEIAYGKQLFYSQECLNKMETIITNSPETIHESPLSDSLKDLKELFRIKQKMISEMMHFNAALLWTTLGVSLFSPSVIIILKLTLVAAVILGSAGYGLIGLGLALAIIGVIYLAVKKPNYFIEVLQLVPVRIALQTLNIKLQEFRKKNKIRELETVEKTLEEANDFLVEQDLQVQIGNLNYQISELKKEIADSKREQEKLAFRIREAREKDFNRENPQAQEIIRNVSERLKDFNSFITEEQRILLSMLGIKTDKTAAWNDPALIDQITAFGKQSSAESLQEMYAAVDYVIHQQQQGPPPDEDD